MTHDERRERLLEEGRERLVAQVRARLEAGERGDGSTVDALFGRALGGVSGSQKVQPHGFYKGTLPRWVGYTAVAAGAFCISMLGIKYLPRIFSDPAALSFKTYATSAGQRATVVLGDGSTALLAPATMLRVSGRSVQLSGEALFTVTHRPGAAFTVRANGVLTRVLGTTFSVRGYESDKVVRIVVAEGKVAVNTLILTVGDAALADHSGVRIQHDVNVANAFSWSAGKLWFNQTTFGDVVQELSRWYKIDIRADDVLLKRPITAALSVDEPPSEVVRLIGIALDANATLNGTRAVFTVRK